VVKPAVYEIAAKESGAFVLAPGWHELVVDDLTNSQTKALQALDVNWFGSYDFSLLFLPRPSIATHVSIFLLPDGQLERAIFFTETHWLGRRRLLSLFGPAPIEPEEVQELLRRRQADVAVLHHLGEEETHGATAPWRRAFVRRMSEDFVIDLPETMEAYLGKLGRSTRKNITHALRRVEREIGPGYRVVQTEREEIAYAHFTALIELNRRRIERKGLSHGWDAELTTRRWQLIRERGAFVGFFDGERLVGGAINLLYARGMVGLLIGHDPAFDHAQIGHATTFYSIRQAIERRLPAFHLLWGYSLAKILFGGREERHYDAAVFRTPWAGWLWRGHCMLTNPGYALRAWLRQQMHPAYIERFRRLRRKCVQIIQVNN